MIKEMKALSMEEARQIIEANHGREDIEPYFKKFVEVNAKDAESMRKELEGLNNHKIKSENIAKIIDFLPEDASEINKVFTEITLDENEIKQITEIVKKHK